MNMREHLSELKKRLKVIAVAYIAALVFWLLVPSEAFDPSALFTGLYRPMISIVLNAAKDLAAGRVTIIQGTLTAPLEVYFLAGAVLALVTASPVIGYEIFKFVDPALYSHEKKKLYRFLSGFIVLFVVGAAIGWFLLAPAIIRFMAYFAQIIGAAPLVTASDYYSLVFVAIGASAIAFTTPAVFLLLVDLGIISTTALTKNRLIVYLALYVVIAALTPEPVVGHFGMFFPIVIMLEISVLIGKRMERKRAARGETVGSTSPRDKCRFCGGDLEEGKSFCPNCARAQE
jgi:sec-independent protein translocase protein TatC